MNSLQKRRSLERIDNLRAELDREVEKWLKLPGKQYDVANNLSGGCIELGEAIEKVEKLEYEEFDHEQYL